MSLLLLALGLLTALSQIHLLRTHPFSVMRYFIPAQPILWIGLPFLMLMAAPPRLRGLSTIAFCIFIGVQSWNCTRLESTYGTVASDVRESRVFVEALDFVKANKSPADAVTYWPHDRFAYRGEYFGLPASDAIGGPARPAPPRFPKPEPTREPLNAPATWMVAKIGVASAQADHNGELERALADLASHSQTTMNARTFADQLLPGRWLVVRVTRDGFRYHAFPLK
jgi:hypothetical protein